MMNKLFILILPCLLLTLSYSYCQSTAEQAEIEQGQPIPYFQLAGVRDSKIKLISRDNIKGKWLVMAFWYRGCAASVKRIARMDSLYKNRDKRMEFVLIGINGRESFGRGIEPLYEALKKRQRLSIPHAFDSVLKTSWSFYSFPKILIVDPSGIVRHITNGDDLTDEKLKALIDGHPVSISAAIGDRPKFFGRNVSDTSRYLMARSTIAFWKNEVQRIPDPESWSYYGPRPGVRIGRTNLATLFTVAYVGQRFWIHSDSMRRKLYPHPLVEVRDPVQFDFDFNTGKGIYNYELILPATRGKREEIMWAMQGDLRTHFLYEAEFEERLLPVWSLTVSEDGLKKLKKPNRIGGVSTNTDGDGGAGGFIRHHMTMPELMHHVTRYIDDGQVPYFDDTGIDFPFDIEMDALMTDKEQVIKALRANGMDLSLVKRKMTVLVIKDAANHN